MSDHYFWYDFLVDGLISILGKNQLTKQYEAITSTLKSAAFAGWVSFSNVCQQHGARCGLRRHCAGLHPELYHKLAGTCHSPHSRLLAPPCYCAEHS